MAAIVMTVEQSGDTLVFERMADATENMRPFLEKVGVFGVSQAQLRLTQRLTPGEDRISSGHLVNSLAPGGKGAVLELDDNKGEYGSIVRYAAQVH